MLKVLLTGTNPIHVGHIPRLNYVSAVAAVKRAYEKLSDTQVDVRPVTLGETLDEYDIVIVFLASMRGFLCKHTLSTLWALHAKKQAIIAFDDWQTAAAVGGIKSAGAEWDKIIAENPFGYGQIEELPKYSAQIKESISKLSADTWDWNVLMPVYLGGDLSKLSVPAPKIFPFNPSVVFKGNYGWAEPNIDEWLKKQKNWILAALHDHSRWVKKSGVTRPVEAYGCKKLKQPRIKEEELFQKYLESEGALSPAYKSCGSGWWRARYGFAADALSIIYGDAAELAMVDKTAYGASSATVIENMSDKERFELALAQREAYYKAAGTYEDMVLQIAAAMPE